MKSQRSQVIALVLLLIIWAVCWRLFISVPHASTAAASNAKASKAAQSDSLLRMRFRRVHSEMDALYHYRINPTPFDTHGNPFRIPGMIDGPINLAASSSTKDVKSSTSMPFDVPPPDFGANLLKRAVAAMRIGGVVTMNGITQLTVDGQLHKEGDIFPVKIQSANAPARSILIRIKHLSTTAVTLALEDAEAGGAEIRVRLN